MNHARSTTDIVSAIGAVVAALGAIVAAIAIPLVTFYRRPSLSLQEDQEEILNRVEGKWIALRCASVGHEQGLAPDSSRDARAGGTSSGTGRFYVLGDYGESRACMDERI